MWKPIYIDGEITNYEVNEYGDVRNIRTCLILKPRIKTGYLCTNISFGGRQRMIRTHKLVCNAFKPVRFKGQTQVNHIDGDKYHNHISNLEWVTPQENTLHAIETGLLPLGEKRTNSKYSEKLIRKICKDIEKNKLTINGIAKKYNVPKSLLHNIYFGDLWKSVKKDYNLDNHRRVTYSQYYEYVDNLLLQGIRPKDVVEEYNNTELSHKIFKSLVYNRNYELKQKGLL